MVNIDSGFMQGGSPEIETPEVEVEVPQPLNFEGGAEVIDDGQGGAIVQALQGMMGQEPVEVATEQYNHDANLAEILDEATLGEISSDLRGK